MAERTCIDCGLRWVVDDAAPPRCRECQVVHTDTEMMHAAADALAPRGSCVACGNYHPHDSPHPNRCPACEAEHLRRNWSGLLMIADALSAPPLTAPERCHFVTDWAPTAASPPPAHDCPPGSMISAAYTIAYGDPSEGAPLVIETPAHYAPRPDALPSNVPDGADASPGVIGDGRAAPAPLLRKAVDPTAVLVDELALPWPARQLEPQARRVLNSIMCEHGPATASVFAGLTAWAQRHGEMTDGGIEFCHPPIQLWRGIGCGSAHLAEALAVLEGRYVVADWCGNERRIVVRVQLALKLWTPVQAATSVWLREHRRAANIGADALEKLAGLRSGRVYRIEGGADCRLDDIERVCAALNLDVEEEFAELRESYMERGL